MMNEVFGVQVTFSQQSEIDTSKTSINVLCLYEAFLQYYFCVSKEIELCLCQEQNVYSFSENLSMNTAFKLHLIQNLRLR